jgi:glycerophosphoryl diester phosphodiesterase
VRALQQRPTATNNTVYISVRFPETLGGYPQMWPEAQLIWWGALPDNNRREFLQQLKAQNVVGIEIFWGDFDSEWITLAHQQDLQVWVYTLNNPVSMIQAMRAGVDAIETDRPRLLRWLRDGIGN